MRQFISIFLFIFFQTFSIYAQIDAGPDIVICEPQDVNLSIKYTPNSVSTSDYTIEPISIEIETLTNPVVINLLSDDSHTDIINIGFNFCFYGNVYNQLVASTNNYLSFDIENANAYSPWNTYPIPSISSIGQVVNAILGPWVDLNPSNGGNISHSIEGTAPFRRFIVSFNDFGYFSCSNMQFNGQIKLFESTNNIEIHIQDQTLCDSWNNGESVLGIINEDETQYIIENGWNNTTMTGDNQAFRFTPNDGENSIEWYDNQGGFIGYGATMLVNPDTTTTYTISVSECPDSYSDEVTIFVSSTIDINPTIDDNMCPDEIYGAIDIEHTGGTHPFTYLWSNNSNTFTSTSKNINNLIADTYNLTITDNMDCEINQSFIISPTPPDLVIQDSIIGARCSGFSDGLIEVLVSGVTPPYQYNWVSENGFTENGNTISELSIGNYQLNLTDNNGCEISSTFYVPENSIIELISEISNYNGYNIRCKGGNAFVSNNVT